MSTTTLPKDIRFGTSFTVPAEIVIVMLVDLVESPVEVAVSVTDDWAGGAAGAV